MVGGGVDRVIYDPVGGSGGGRGRLGRGLFSGLDFGPEGVVIEALLDEARASLEEGVFDARVGVEAIAAVFLFRVVARLALGAGRAVSGGLDRRSEDDPLARGGRHSALVLPLRPFLSVILRRPERAPLVVLLICAVLR